MSLRWHDVTIPMRPEMAVWPGDPPFECAPDARISQGDSCNTSHLRLSTHTGTHCDAPWHFIDSGKRLHEIDIAMFFGSARLIEIPDGVDSIHAADLGPERLPQRLLIRTRNSNRPCDAPFYDDFVALEEDAARRLVEEGVRLAGIDYLSIAPRGNSGPTHRVLLGSDVLVVEGLRLAGLPCGDCEFVVFPMALHAADGAPCRAFVGTCA